MNKAQQIELLASVAIEAVCIGRKAGLTDAQIIDGIADGFGRTGMAAQQARKLAEIGLETAVKAAEGRA